MSAVHTLLPHDLLGGTRCGHAGPRGQHRGGSRSRRYLFVPTARPIAPTHRLSGQQLRVMQAIETCRTVALGGHMAQLRPVWGPGPAVPLVWQSPLSQVPNPGQAALGRGTLLRAFRHSLFSLCPDPPARAQPLGPRQSPDPLRPPLPERRGHLADVRTRSQVARR